MKQVLYCTYCSRGKSGKRGEIYAVRRYASPRLRGIFEKSRENGAAFAILSGRFGLTGPYKRIPFYDHLLKSGEIAVILPQMVDYLLRKGYREVCFFHESERAFPQVKPYIDAIKRACRLAQARLKMTRIK